MLTVGYSFSGTYPEPYRKISVEVELSGWRSLTVTFNNKDRIQKQKAKGLNIVEGAV